MRSCSTPEGLSCEDLNFSSPASAAYEQLLLKLNGVEDESCLGLAFVAAPVICFKRRQMPC